MSYLINERVKEVPARYLQIEIEYASQEEQRKLKELCENEVQITTNSANSYLLYCCGITDVIDLTRPCDYSVAGSGPDIDTDFSPSGRPLLFKLLQEQLGERNIARLNVYKPWNLKNSLISFTKLIPQLDQKGDQALYPSGKPMYRTYQEGELISAQIPDAVRGRRTTWKLLQEDKSHRDLIVDNQEVFSYAGPMDGQPQTTGPHACGCLISSRPICDDVPVRADYEGVQVTQWEKEVLEKLGYIKYDILVLDNLNITQQACENIGKPFSWIETIALDDPEAMAMISTPHSGGFNQIEQPWITEILAQCKPKNVEELAIVLALIRPGPLDAGLTKDYIKYATTGVTQNHLHPLLDDILAETGGVLVYQEQVMKACSALSGMDLTTADQLRRAMGKKSVELMGKYKTIFVDGCWTHSQIEAEEAAEIWSAIEKFADYGFNKSHALAYAILTYWHGYLKTYHLQAYMSALLTVQRTKPEKMQKYMQEATTLGLEILPPDVNTSGRKFNTKGDNQIVFGFGALAGMGPTAVDYVLEARGDKPFKDIIEFMERVNKSKVNSKVLGILARVGAFDSFGYDRHLLVDAISDLQKYFKLKEAYYTSLAAADIRDEEIADWDVEFAAWSIAKKAKQVIKLAEPFKCPVRKRKIFWDPPRPKKPGKKKRKDMPEAPQLNSLKLTDNEGNVTKRVTLEMLKWEAQASGLFISGHPLQLLDLPDNLNTRCFIDIDPEEYPQGKTLGSILAIKTRAIKSGINRGKKMATLILQDQTSYAELTVFAKQWQQEAFQELEVGDTILLAYRVNTVKSTKADDEEEKDTTLKLFAKSIRRISE